MRERRRDTLHSQTVTDMLQIWYERNTFISLCFVYVYVLWLDNIDRQLTCANWLRIMAHLTGFSVSLTWQRDVKQVKCSSTEMLYVAASTVAPSTGAKLPPRITSSRLCRVNCLSHFCCRLPSVCVNSRKNNFWLKFSASANIIWRYCTECAT